MSRPLSLSLLLIAATACGLSDPKSTTDSDTDLHTDDTDVAVYPDCTKEEGDDYWLSALAVDGDELVVSLSYSGGCETHDFTLCWPEEAWAESYPVQVWLEVHHDANGDACEAEIDEDVRLDLLPLQQAYQDGYSSASGDITIHVDGESVLYSF